MLINDDLQTYVASNATISKCVRIRMYELSSDMFEISALHFTRKLEARYEAPSVARSRMEPSISLIQVKIKV
jgi:hypothetical protein